MSDTVDDLKLIEALNDLRREIRRDAAALRQEVREDVRAVRLEAVEAYAGISRKLVWAILVLGLALGGKGLLGLLLQAGW